MISVVIPVYNSKTEDLSRCLQSIVNQTACDHEIIVVDDGSTDEVCCRYLAMLPAQDPHIRVIRQENKGVSAARNTGIEETVGEYVAFVDSDDEILNHFLDRAYGLARQYDLDVVIGSLTGWNSRGLVAQGSGSWQIYMGDDILLIKRSICEIPQEGWRSEILGSPCGRIFRGDLVRKVRFDETVRICEDQLYNLYVLDESKRVGVAPEFWYRYHQQEGSAMHSITDQMDFMPYYRQLHCYMQKEKDEEIRVRINEKIIGYYSSLSRQAMIRASDFQTWRDMVRRYGKEPLFEEAVRYYEKYGKKVSLSRRSRWYLFAHQRYRLLYAYYCWTKKKPEGGGRE